MIVAVSSALLARNTRSLIPLSTLLRVEGHLAVTGIQELLLRCALVFIFWVTHFASEKILARDLAWVRN